MKFRLSEQTKAMLSQNNTCMMNTKPKGYYNSKEFYQRRPDLAPRDIYLREGRLIKMEEVDKYLKKISKETIWEKLGKFISRFRKK